MNYFLKFLGVGNTNEELCTRWMELGAFYPFSRNHNNKGSRSQEPYTFSQQLTDTSRQILNVRYSLLPYYYTLFYYASRPVSSTEQPASTVTRPLFFEFPDDQNTYAIDKQFMVGDGLLVSPVLTQGKPVERGSSICLICVILYSCILSRFHICDCLLS